MYAAAALVSRYAPGISAVSVYVPFLAFASFALQNDVLLFTRSSFPPFSLLPFDL
jgi:hypothetical protein